MYTAHFKIRAPQIRQVREDTDYESGERPESDGGEDKRNN